MQAEELRERQAPLKDRYRSEPDSAFATLTASGRVDIDTISCKIQRTSDEPTVAGLHPMAGGDGSWKCAAEMLLESLISCAGVTFGAVCTAMKIPVTSAKLTAEGDLDFRGTMGVDRSIPVGFLEIQLKFELDSAADDASLEKAVELAERYCVVAQSVSNVQAGWSRTKSEAAK